MPLNSAPVSDRLAYWVAVSGGAGHFKVWPGTVGGLVGILFALALLPVTKPVAAAACIALFLVGLWASGRTAVLLGTDDPQVVVVDETFGAAATLCMLPPEPLWWALGFVAFRYFDAAKPWPIVLLHHHVRGGLGIMIDDAAAAIVAGASVLLVRHLFLLAVG